MENKYKIKPLIFNEMSVNGDPVWIASTPLCTYTVIEYEEAWHCYISGVWWMNELPTKRAAINACNEHFKQAITSIIK